MHAVAAGFRSRAARLAELRLLALRGYSAPASAAPAADDETRAALGYCVQLVRKYDYDNYIWATQLPKEHRPAVFALRAFNVETGTIADQIKSGEAALGRVRFQWWRDALAGAFKGVPPKHPVMLALASVLKSKPDIKAYHLRRMVDAREADYLTEQPPLDLAGLEDYAEGSASQLLYAHLAALGVKSRDADHAASHLGKAVGLTTLLRASAVHASRRRSYLPLDLCAKHGVSQEDVYRGAAGEGLKDVAHQVASAARGHLDEARRLRDGVPREARAVLLPAVACANTLALLECRDFNVFDPALLARPGGGGAGGGGVTPLWYVLQLKYHLVVGSY